MKNEIQIKFDEIASEYVNKYEHPTNILQFEKIRRMELLLSYAAKLPVESLLDAGCGVGNVLAALNDQSPNLKCIGVDFSHRMLKEGQARNLAGVHLVQTHVELLPFVDSSFDLIYALGVIDYLKDLPQFFQTVQRTLKPQGHFIFTYPNGNSLNRALCTLVKTYFSRSKAIRASAKNSAYIDHLIAEHGFQLKNKHFITFGNGLISFPWSISLSKIIERWCGQQPIGRYLGWSCFCIVHKNSQ